jgi:TPR repeat protein
MTYLADAYVIGEEVTKSTSEAETWWNAAAAIYRKRAARGDVEAMNVLASRYKYGYGPYGAKLGTNEVESARWSKAATAAYQAVAARGDASAMNELAHRYDFGNGVKESKAEVARWEKAAAAAYLKSAKAGNTKAMIRLAQLYRFGTGVAEDADVALRWYRAAAAKGNSDAMLRLASEAHNDQEATRWIRMAAAAGASSAMYRLALDYEIGGHGVRANATLATPWYKKAALKGHSAAITSLHDAHFRTLIAKTAAAKTETVGPFARPPGGGLGTRCTPLQDSNYNIMLNEPPIVAFEIVSSREYAGGTEWKLHAAGADPEGYTMLFTYSVTGGELIGGTPMAGDPDSSYATWNLTKPGSYIATVEVDDGAGCIASASYSVWFIENFRGAVPGVRTPS